MRLPIRPSLRNSHHRTWYQPKPLMPAELLRIIEEHLHTDADSQKRPSRLHKP